MNALARRIERLNREFARAKMEGRDLVPFLRRARNLSQAFHRLQFELETRG
jgi:hypothetical protein